MNLAPDAGQFQYDLMAAALRYIESRRDEQKERLAMFLPI